MTREVSFRNRQRTRALNIPLLRRITRHVLESDLGVASCELGVHLVEPEEMERVNQQFLGHEGSTDVITFDYRSSVQGRAVLPRGPNRRKCITRQQAQAAAQQRRPTVLHGEIFISVADAVKQAREFRTAWQSEIIRYVVHGLLHLRGHDDLQPAARKVMKREENRLVRLIESQFAIKRLARTRNSKLKTRNSF